ncbi:uncharacterized protein LOC142504935 [Primulina tabacum]|uniref:uncharacterized protein LOC142504935 n=1 Tax=Primulina tabacum TaxID=48773 RepID=UPI003F5A794A
MGPEKKMLRIAPDLDPRFMEELITCLQVNLSVFTWSAQELTGTTPDWRRSVEHLAECPPKRGIEANPEKVRAIQDMVPPRGPNDVQKLVGRIAELARFISRSAHRSSPFFRTLRKAKKFEWDTDCEKAFGDLKKYLAELPVLAKPAAGEPWWVYLSAPREL